MTLSSNSLNLKYFDISSRINIYGAYVIFMSVKAHFKLNSKFDVTLSLLKTIKEDKVATKNKIYFVLKNLTEKYSTTDIILIFVENELTDNDTLLNIDYKELSRSIKDRLSSVDRTILKDFENIIRYCKSKNLKLKDALNSELIVKMYLKEYITPEVVLAIDNITGVLSQEITEDNPLLNITCDKLLKYKKLFSFNSKTIKDLLAKANKNVCLEDIL